MTFIHTKARPLAQARVRFPDPFGNLTIYPRPLSGAVLVTVPLLMPFVLAGQQSISGIREGAVKS
jgi:ABC-type glycerol-3-phosphate transport system permease component